MTDQSGAPGDRFPSSSSAIEQFAFKVGIMGAIERAEPRSMENPHMPEARPEECALNIRDVPTPISGQEEALIQISSAGVCHSALGG